MSKLTFTVQFDSENQPTYCWTAKWSWKFCIISKWACQDHGKEEMVANIEEKKLSVWIVCIYCLVYYIYFCGCWRCFCFICCQIVVSDSLLLELCHYFFLLPLFKIDIWGLVNITLKKITLYKKSNNVLRKLSLISFW